MKVKDLWAFECYGDVDRVSKDSILSLLEFLNTKGAGIGDRKPYCKEDCYDMHFLMMFVLKMRGEYEGEIDRFVRARLEV